MRRLMALLSALAIIAGGSMSALAVSHLADPPDPVVAPIVAAAADCVVHEMETEEVAPGVVLTWTGSFWCADAPGSGTYAVAVSAQNGADSDAAVAIQTLVLSHTTPRPGGTGPVASAEADGLPLELAAGTDGEFDVSGDYELVDTDEGAKANLHLRAGGVVDGTGDLFTLGINVHLREPGAVEEPAEPAPPAEENGPPAEAGQPAEENGRSIAIERLTENRDRLPEQAWAGLDRAIEAVTKGGENGDAEAGDAENGNAGRGENAGPPISVPPVAPGPPAGVPGGGP